MQLCSLPLLAFALGRLEVKQLGAQARWALAIIAGLIVLPLLQLVPLPPTIWTSLPGRAPFAAAYEAAGMAVPWLPLSLDPEATWFSFLSLLPAVAVFLALMALDLKLRRLIGFVILGFAFASVLLGLAQLAGGMESPLRFYNPTSDTDSVGFFANRNHYTALLTAAIPIAAGLSMGFAGERTARRRPALLLLLIAYAVLLTGVGMAHSRAGLLLAFVAVIASTGLVWAARNNGEPLAGRFKFPLLFAAANFCGLFLAFQFGFVGLANRLEKEGLVSDLRRPIAEVTLHAIEGNLPFGVGFGAFEPVYQIYEPVSLALPPFINHAHDDWLELVLDGGLPVVALLIGFLVWFAFAGVRAWRGLYPAGSPVDQAVARAGPIIVGMLLLHSIVDYPLRTTSMMVVFAFAAALMVPARESRASGRGVRRSYRPEERPLSPLAQRLRGAR